VNYIVYDVEQRSPDWYALRLGRLTGSCADAMLSAAPKGKSESAAKRNLRVSLAIERITKEPDEETFTSRDVKRGETMEPDARRAYEAATGRLLSTVGFLAHPALLTGCSPDALYRDEGVIDFKCPRPGNHLEYLRGDFPLEYRRQLTHNLWITGAQWAEFVSYCPKFPEPLRLCIQRMDRTSVDLVAYEQTVKDFLAQVDIEVQAIATMTALRSVLEKAVA
jgi:hypothetical protein